MSEPDKKIAGVDLESDPLARVLRALRYRKASKREARSVVARIEQKVTETRAHFHCPKPLESVWVMDRGKMPQRVCLVVRRADERMICTISLQSNSRGGQIDKMPDTYSMQGISAQYSQIKESEFLQAYRQHIQNSPEVIPPESRPVPVSSARRSAKEVARGLLGRALSWRPGHNNSSPDYPKNGRS